MIDWIWFFICLIGTFCMMPIHFFSVEHVKFEEKYGKEKGGKITRIFGMASGWGFFLFLFGVWFTPQPRFTIPLLQDLVIIIPFINFPIPWTHIFIFLPFLILAAWFGIVGVRGTTLEVSETHRAVKIITTGIYSRMRHPQYFGSMLAHVGFSFLVSGWFSLLATPLIILYNYLTAWKEEKELVKEFGKEYEDYKKEVPMFLPKFKK